MDAVNIDDLRRIARRRLPKPVYDYVAGGSYRELTLARNRADLDALVFAGNNMTDVLAPNTLTSLVGDPASMPLGCSALVMTLDVHVHSQRWADTRNGLTSPIRVTPRDCAATWIGRGWCATY